MITSIMSHGPLSISFLMLNSLQDCSSLASLATVAVFFCLLLCRPLLLYIGMECLYLAQRFIMAKYGFTHRGYG